MDDETRIGFFSPLRFPNRQGEYSNSHRKIEKIAHYFMIVLLIIIISFYVFFITTIVLDKYSSNSINFHINFPYEKQYERNKFLYKKAECLTICNLKDEPFEILFLLNRKSKIKSYKPVTIESSTDSQLSCITTAKKKGNYTPEIIDKFKFNKSSDDKITINELANVGKNKYYWGQQQKHDDHKEPNQENEIKHSSISIFTHRYKEKMTLKKVIHYALNINYNSTDSHVILKKYNENSFQLSIKEDNSQNDEEIIIDNLFSVYNGNFIEQY